MNMGLEHDTACDAPCSRCGSDWTCPYMRIGCDIDYQKHLCPTCLQMELIRQPKGPMILDRLPDRPGRVTGLQYIGYWHSVGLDRLTGLPTQTGHEFNRYLEHFEYLPVPSYFVDTTWDAQEKALVLAYLRAGTPLDHWRGFSWCRFGCDHRTAEQGTADLSDGTYVWPSGFPHYIERHHVRVPQEFVDHIKKAPRP